MSQPLSSSSIPKVIRNESRPCVIVLLLNNWEISFVIVRILAHSEGCRYDDVNRATQRLHSHLASLLRPQRPTQSSMDTRDNDDHNDNNMQAENTTPAQPTAPAEIEMQDLDDSTVESSTSTPLNASTTSLASSLSERTGLRRTRVEDDHDDERDRRHPSERVGSPLNSPPSLQSSSSLSALHTAESASTSYTSGPPSFSGQLPASSNSAAPASSGPFRFFQHISCPPSTAST